MVARLRRVARRYHGVGRQDRYRQKGGLEARRDDQTLRPFSLVSSSPSEELLRVERRRRAEPSHGFGRNCGRSDLLGSGKQVLLENLWPRLEGIARESAQVLDCGSLLAGGLPHFKTCRIFPRVRTIALPPSAPRARAASPVPAARRDCAPPLHGPWPARRPAIPAQRSRLPTRFRADEFQIHAR